MSEDTEENFFAAASALLGLPIKPEHYDDALAAFRVLTAQAKLVTEFLIPDEIDAAPRFTP
jgi:hypothetical protein